MAVTRQVDWPIDPQFTDRWSPRAFSTEPITEEILKTLLEAARWAPSCYNEQPWRFIYALQDSDLAIFRRLIVDSNRSWADRVPSLVVAMARRHFSRNGKKNRYAEFDTGAAWMAIALQARTMGLYAHAMGGIHRERAYELLHIPREEYSIICGIAIGYYGDPALLTPEQRSNEHPTPRMPITEFATEGIYNT